MSSRKLLSSDYRCVWDIYHKNSVIGIAGYSEDQGSQAIIGQQLPSECLNEKYNNISKFCLYTLMRKTLMTGSSSRLFFVFFCKNFGFLYTYIATNYQPLDSWKYYKSQLQYTRLSPHATLSNCSRIQCVLAISNLGSLTLRGIDDTMYYPTGWFHKIATGHYVIEISLYMTGLFKRRPLA